MLFCIGLIMTGMAWIGYKQPPTWQKSVYIDKLGDVAIIEPMWNSRGIVLVFADSSKFPANNLGRTIAENGITAVMVDALQYLKNQNAKTGQCLGVQQINSVIDKLKQNLPANQLIVAGIGEGALIPFIHAQSGPESGVTNLSIDFSVLLPEDLLLCPPLSNRHEKQHNLLSSPKLAGNWRSIWADQPDDETGILIRALGNVDTRIAAYDTPPDTLLLEEIKTIFGQAKQSAPPMPVVELPAGKSADTVTIFYSGDGGWRDLDRTVAGEMVNQQYPVVGVDVLRYFWEHKTAQQAAADLAATMSFYRQNWNVKSFVLAGYSFGADILPAIYNRLPQPDKESVRLLALLALAKEADFEIHVAGWLGQKGNEQPIADELAQIPKNKLLCIYGKEEKTETSCTTLQNTEATILELPGGHHFDQDYPKLTRQILDVYRQHGIIYKPG